MKALRHAEVIYIYHLFFLSSASSASKEVPLDEAMKSQGLDTTPTTTTTPDKSSKKQKKSSSNDSPLPKKTAKKDFSDSFCAESDFEDEDATKASPSPKKKSKSKPKKKASKASSSDEQ